MQRRRFGLSCLLLASAGIAGRAAHAQSNVSDVPVGHWQATLGPADNCTEIGLEIERGADGRLMAWFTNSLLNFFRMALPPLEADGDGRWRIRAYDVLIQARSGSLDVTGLMDDPVLLRRASSALARPTHALPPAGPAPRWQLRLGGAIYAPVCVSGGVGFVGNADGVFHAIDLAEGRSRWTFAPGRAIHGEASASDDAVLFACDDGRLYKLDAGDGRPLWRYELGDERVPRVPPNPFVFDYDHQAPRPVVSGGVVYIGAGDGGVHAIDAATGQRLWRFQAAGKVRATATVLGSQLVVGSRSNTLHVLDRQSGRELSRIDTSGPVTSTALALGDRFIVGHRGSRLAAHRVGAGTTTPLWEQPYWGSWVESSAVAWNDEAYIGSGDLFLVSAFDPLSGRNRWRSFVGGWVLQRPAVTQRHVIVGISGARRRPAHFVEQRGGVAVLERSSGRVLWSWTAPSSPGQFLFGIVAAPQVVGNEVVVGGIDGSLYALPLPT